MDDAPTAAEQDWPRLPILRMIILPAIIAAAIATTTVALALQGPRSTDRTSVPTARSAASG